MSELTFEWDQTKADSNIKKHGISFEEAQSVFDDIHARLITDPESSYGEERFIILGQNAELKVLVICHCYREANDRIRIISARKADKHERKQYEVFKYA